MFAYSLRFTQELIISLRTEAFLQIHLTTKKKRVYSLDESDPFLLETTGGMHG